MLCDEDRNTCTEMTPRKVRMRKVRMRYPLKAAAGAKYAGPAPCIQAITLLACMIFIGIANGEFFRNI